ncbi:MAG: hypothetical protein LBM71_01360 [Elusimicrobiota bacterium]|jgi:hypothetical protein|nr:hypothetical protein [Elusimicrobiota bacterium]
MNPQENTNISIETKAPTYLFVLAAAAVFIVVFFAMQLREVPLDAGVVKAILLDESKEQASPVKKYFPKPYSVNDLARGDQ